MVPAGRRVDLRRAAELRAHADERRGKQPAAVEVANERREALIERRGLSPHGTRDVVVVVPAAVGERDESHARLHEPAGQQHPHARLILAVLVLDLVRLLLEIERLLRLGGTDEAVGPLVERIERVERVALLLVAEVRVHHVEHPATLVEPCHVDARRQVEVAHLEVGVGRVGAQTECRVGRTEIAGAGELVGLAGNADVRRQVLAGTELVRDHRPEARVLERRARAVAREHVVRAALVGGLAMRHRPADRELVGDLRRVRQHLAEPHAGEHRLDAAERAAVLGRRERLGIERLLVGVAAGEIDVDDRLRDALAGGFAFGGMGRLHAEVVTE